MTAAREGFIYGHRPTSMYGRQLIRVSPGIAADKASAHCLFTYSLNIYSISTLIYHRHCAQQLQVYNRSGYLVDELVVQSPHNPDNT